MKDDGRRSKETDPLKRPVLTYVNIRSFIRSHEENFHLPETLIKLVAVYVVTQVHNKPGSDLSQSSGIKGKTPCKRESQIGGITFFGFVIVAFWVHLS